MHGFGWWKEDGATDPFLDFFLPSLSSALKHPNVLKQFPHLCERNLCTKQQQQQEWRGGQGGSARALQRVAGLFCNNTCTSRGGEVGLSRSSLPPKAHGVLLQGSPPGFSSAPPRWPLPLLTLDTHTFPSARTQRRHLFTFLALALE